MSGAKAAGIAIGAVFVLGSILWVVKANADYDNAKANQDKSSLAKRAADAIATRDPAVMRRVAEEMDREGAKELAEGLRMAADLAIGQREAMP